MTIANDGGCDEHDHFGAGRVAPGGADQPAQQRQPVCTRHGHPAAVFRAIDEAAQQHGLLVVHRHLAVDGALGELRLAIDARFLLHGGKFLAEVNGDDAVGVDARLDLQHHAGVAVLVGVHGLAALRRLRLLLDGNLVAANGGTGLTTPGISGNVLTSNGTGGWVRAPVVATVTSDVYSNTAGGTSALATLTGGGYNGGANSAFGFSTLFANTTGSNNVALGAGSLQNNTTGSYSVAVGTGALSSSVAYGFNVALGYGTGSHVNGGYFNTLLGTTAGGQTLTSGNQNTLVGGYADVVAGTDNNSIVIGYNAVGQGSNTAVIGNSSVTTVGGYGSWTNFSDRREKENIQDLSLGLAFIQKLRPVSYNYISQPGVGREGLIAQEVEEAAQALGVTFHGVERPSTHNGRYSLSYPALVMPLINATKELKAENDALKAGNDALKAENEAQKTRLDALERQMAALLALVKPQQ